MKRHAIRILFAVPLAFLGSPAVFAEDYNFTVPVSIAELPPEIREIEINCGVWGGARARPVARTTWRRLRATPREQRRLQWRS